MLTIGLPFHNSEDTLADTIRSVYAQTFQDWRLLLVDDGSTDMSLDIARSVLDERVHVVADGRNLGLAARLNQIAEFAETEFLARLDADDLMHPCRLERQLKMLESDPSLALVDTGLVSIDADNRPRGVRCCQEFQTSGPGLIAGRIPVHCAVMGRTHWFKQNRYDTRVRRAQDFELWNRAYANGSMRLKRVPEPLYFYRESGPGTYARAKSSHEVVRGVIRRDGPTVIGWPRTAVEISKSYIKQAAYFVTSRIHLDHHLVASRNSSLDAGTERRYTEVINSILNTPIPGVPLEPVALGTGPLMSTCRTR